MIDPREQGLPRWAQSIITSLRIKVQEIEKKLEMAERRNAVGTSGKIRVAASGFGVDDWVAMPDWSMVRFEVSGGHIDVRLEKDRLDVNGHPDQLMVFPMAGNCLQVRIGRRVP